MLHAASVPRRHRWKTQQCPLLHRLCRYVWSPAVKSRLWPRVGLKPCCFFVRRGTRLLGPTHDAACCGAQRGRPGPRRDVSLSSPALSHAHLRAGPVDRSGRNGAFRVQLKLADEQERERPSVCVSPCVRQGFFCSTEDEFDDWCVRIRRVSWVSVTRERVLFDRMVRDDMTVLFQLSCHRGGLPMFELVDSQPSHMVSVDALNLTPGK